jgi:CheY-like chemotaxis protein
MKRSHIIVVEDSPELRYALAKLLERAGYVVHQFPARLVAEHLLRHLKQSNYVIMRGPPRQGHTTPPIPK